MAIALAACTGPEPNGALWVPDGYEVEMVAGPPLVERPMIIDDDDQGHLYVAESSGSNDRVEQQLIDRPHSILRLEDIDGDGTYDSRTVFADKLMLPEGVLWHDGSVYVAAPPQIWKLTDSDDDGVADQREVWFDAKTLTGCANDLHGPYLGPDGWIYWTKGAFAEQTYERPGRSPLITRAAHIFRRRPEGGPIESVMAGGMDNPIEVAFSPEGERFLTSTFVEHPKLGRRDGLLHALYGGVYGKIHGVTDSHPMTGGFNTVMTQMDATVPVGLTRESESGDLLVSLFNMHKVTRHKLTPQGATFQTEESDFLTSDSFDFHPTDVMQDADGSILVVDTGAWYKICCPTSQLSKPEVLGAIYRVRRKDAARVENPRGEELDWSELSPAQLVALLDDNRPAVRSRATRLGARVGVDALRDLEGSARARRNAVWALTQIPGDKAREAVRAALNDLDETVRHTALHSASVWHDRAALEPTLKQLRTGSPAIQRVAAEALGRFGDSATVPDLLNEVAETDDPALLHSLTYALIEIADPTATRQGLKSASAQIRRASLIALDQMETKSLGPQTVVPLLSSNHALLAETAAWIAGQHPEWGGALAGYFRDRLDQPGTLKQIQRFTGHPTIQQMLARAAATGHVSAVQAMAAAPVDETPKGWSEALVNALTSGSPDLTAAAVDAAGNLPRPEAGDPHLDSALIQVARDDKAPDTVRAAAGEASIESLDKVDPALFDFLAANVSADQPVEVRGPAARALSQAPLSEQQLTKLIDSLGQAGPMELPYLVEAFRHGSSAELGLHMLETVEGTGLNLRADILESVTEAYPEQVREQARKLLADGEVDRYSQRRKIDDLLSSLEGADIRRGQAVFNSHQAACSACHRIGYQGGAVGPDLSRIGRTRTERDLLESIVYPSLSFVRSFEPIVVATADDLHSGVTLEESDTHILLATSADERVRIANVDIEEVRPGTVSVMPSGLDEQLTRQDLLDLVVFLKDTAYKPWDERKP